MIINPKETFTLKAKKALESFKFTINNSSQEDTNDFEKKDFLVGNHILKNVTSNNNYD